MTIAAVYIFYS